MHHLKKVSIVCTNHKEHDDPHQIEPVDCGNTPQNPEEFMPERGRRDNKSRYKQAYLVKSIAPRLHVHRKAGPDHDGVVTDNAEAEKIDDPSGLNACQRGEGGDNMFFYGKRRKGQGKTGQKAEKDYDPYRNGALTRREYSVVCPHRFYSASPLGTARWTI